MDAYTDKGMDAKEDVVFVCGRGGSGKSTYAKSFTGHTVVALDEVVRTHLTKDWGTNDAFQIYLPGKLPELKDRFADLVAAEAGAARQIVYEGSIKDIDLMRKIAKGRPFRLVYVRPASLNNFRRNVLKRFELDVANGTRTLGYVWSALTEEHVADYHLNGLDGKLVRGLLEGVIEAQYQQRDSHLPLLARDGISITLVET